LTLELMNSLPLHDYAELVSGAALWLPVQAYYACHGMGQAALCALGCTMPQRPTHQSFLAMVSRQVVGVGLLAAPFSTVCVGDCTQGTEEFRCSQATPDEVRLASNLATVGASVSAEVMVAKCLKTTRARRLLHRHKEARGRRSRLTHTEKTAICDRMDPTTCVDFLWRMRIEANYEDPDAALYGQAPAGALTYCNDVLWVTSSICLQFDHIIRRKVGQTAYRELFSAFSTRSV
jgi:hypothetical protein